MFVVMAINAKQLPIAAVRGIVVVVVIPVVHGKLHDVAAIEFPRATSADPRINLERPLAIAGCALLARTAGVGDNMIQLGAVGLA